MKRIEIKVETSMKEGKFQHDVCETGITTNTRHKYALGSAFLNLQKAINEMIYFRLPADSQNKVISKIEYRVKT